MGLGKKVRLNRLFGHASGRMCSVAVDHFVAYHLGMPEGLADLPRVIGAVVAGTPDAITMTRGPALSCWHPYAGRVPLIVQSVAARPDDSADEQLSMPEDALHIGADAFAFLAPLQHAKRSDHQEHQRDSSDCSCIHLSPFSSHWRVMAFNHPSVIKKPACAGFD